LIEVAGSSPVVPAIFLNHLEGSLVRFGAQLVHNG
jgi:hypothetical protein